MDLKEQLTSEIKELRFSSPREAYMLSEELLSIGIREGDKETIALAYLYIGHICYGRGTFSKAVAYIKKAIRIQRAENLEEQLIASYNILACVYFMDNDELMGLEYLLKALELSKKWKNYYYLAALHNNLGELCFEFQDLEKAIYYYTKGFEYNQESERLGTGNCLSSGRMDMNMAFCYLRAGAVEKAGSYYDKIRADMEEWEFFSQYFCICSCGAQIYYAKNEKERAYEICCTVLDKLDEDSYVYEFFHHLIAVAGLFIDMEKWKDAWDMIGKLEMLASREGNMNCTKQVYDLRIRYHQKCRGCKIEQLLEDYRGFYKAQKQVEERIRHSTATAIDNRFALETENEEYEKLKENREKLEQNSMRDGLTGINNRYALNRFFEQNFAGTKEKGLAFGLMIMDIDYFKQYNDTYGHVAGDTCIRKVAGVISEVSVGSFCARYGGDEFFVSTIGKENKDFTVMAEHLVDQVRKLNLTFERPDGKGIVTISLGGVNVAPEGFQTVTDFIHRADMLLYEVKERKKDAGKVVFTLH